MQLKKQGDDIFLRVDPGEHLIASLTEVAREMPIGSAAITSGLGMLSSATLGFFDVVIDDYERQEFDGIFDLSVIMGSITWLEGAPYPHVHIVFNDRSYNTFSGHLIEATAHITMEVFLRKLDRLDLNRIRLPNCPASRVVAGEIRQQ